MSIQTIMNADESGKELVDFARLEAEKLVKNGLKRAQIRTIFTEVRQIEALWKTRNGDARRRLNLLKPKLAYQTARNASVEELRAVLSAAIDEVEKAPEDKKDAAFQRLMDLFEAILAYHRALGGQERN